MITGNYKLIANPTLWENVTSNQVRLLVDTSLAGSEITLPLISDIKSANNVEIFIVDKNKNAGANNIGILPGLPELRSDVVGLGNIGPNLAIQMNGDIADRFVPGMQFNTSGLGANDSITHQVVAVNTAQGPGGMITQVSCGTLQQCQIKAGAQARYDARVSPDSVNGASSSIIEMNGGIALLKVAGPNEWISIVVPAP